jgi:mono/diheme cytochrome c family protein
VKDLLQVGAAWQFRRAILGPFLPVMAAALSSVAAAQTPTAAPPPTAPPEAATVSRYCVTCHNARAKTGGLVLDPTQLTNIGPHADTWEKVVRKLRGNAMPPPSASRPAPEAVKSLVAYLETNLDRAAAAKPSPGKLPLFHRLSRTEYRNAVRDLLDLDDLPKEVDISFLLPADNVSSGFDNIADLLFLSPSTTERYIDAARKISRIAVGDPKMPLLVNIYKLDPEHPQDERVEELPVGTRGGMAIRAYLPVDATYAIKVEPAGVPREAQQVEVTVDGERVQLANLGGGNAPTGRAARGATVQALDFRIPLKAGRKLIGVSFIQRTEASDESTLRPRMRGRGTLPALASVTLSGPYDVTSPGSSPSRQRIFACRPASATQESACAKQILSSLVRRAYRRPATDVDLEDLLPFYLAGRKERDFDLGIQRALERLLVSPQFLFRIERQPNTAAAGTAFRISDLELASRLSFFLWSSIPDDELLTAATRGTLRNDKVLEVQVKRMLADPRSDALVSNFAAQWLYLRDIAAKQPDEILFPDFDETLRAAMERETELFLASVLRENRSVLDLLSANYTFVNERLARHYGIPNVKGAAFRRVEFPATSPRGGLLGQGSLLTITSYANRTSPVLRGKWVLENILSSPPPPPPPNIPALSTDAGNPEKPLTIREAMTRHRANAVCASCHARMDPIGFAMENFDAVGRWRDTDSGSAIDASGEFPGGVKFNGIAGLKKELLSQSPEVASTVAERLLMFALGRNLQFYDAPEVRAIVRQAAPSNYTMSSLVLGVVKSRPFQTREAAAASLAKK